MQLDDLDLIVYDFEVFAHDWLVVFKDQLGAYTSFWNDPENLYDFMNANEEAVFVGFNSKHYDQYILKALMAGCTPEEAKEVNDFIIESGDPGWQHPYLNIAGKPRFWFNNSDLMDDMMKGTSLKSIEGHLGMSVEESTVDFTYTKKLTEEQRKEVEHYCRHDVDATMELLELRKDYLETKMHLAGMADINQIRALNMTDPMLAAAFMGATAVADIAEDERDYEFPDRLEYRFIPTEVLAFFERIWNDEIPDEELFSSKLEIDIGGCPTVYGFGGIHGALPKYKQKATEDTLILNYDVASLYPSLMIEYGYVSRAVPSPEVFANVRSERFDAKAKGDKKTANALKSPLNKAYGAMLNKYNPMYDPKMARSVCISGQLSITELAVVYSRIEGLQIIQLNTDGIMVSIPKESYRELVAVNDWWQQQTSLVLEEDKIDFIWQKDVNNYVCRKMDGTEKVKGGYLVRGVNPIGAWSVNFNATIVAEALKKYLLDGIPVADTINACDDPYQFQLIAKAGGKYSRVYQEIFPEPVGEAGTETVERQKCNRVFACNDERYGRLYKVKKSDGKVAKIESLPEHCLVWNDDIQKNPPAISLIDKSYYIQLAEKRAQDFKESEMATTTETKSAPKRAASKTSKTEDYSKLNVYQKLAIARRMILDEGLVPSGKNFHLEFEFFELKDITPAQTRIFEKVGLIELFDEVKRGKTFLTDVSEDCTRNLIDEREPEHYALSRVINTDQPDEFIEFRTDWAELEPIVSKQTGKEAQNALQRKGSETTYLRRYNKLKVLDLTETDANEANSGADEEKTPAKSASDSAKPVRKTTTRKSAAKPSTEADKKAAAKKVTNASGKANNLQVTQLKKAIKTLKSEHGDKPEVGAYITELGASTNNLKDITKTQAEEAIQVIGEMKEKFDTEGAE